MRRDAIRTTHDLAQFLEETARVLRQIPAIDLTGVTSDISDDVSGQLRETKTRGSQTEDELILLAEELPSMSRAEAESKLNSLTVKAIRVIAPMLAVRVPSRATKAESIRVLLVQLFDAPAGQELIRTYHKRYGGSSQAGTSGIARELSQRPGRRGKI